MNRVVSASVALIATLFGLMLAPGLAPVATAATTQGYAYDGYHQSAASTHTTREPGRPTSFGRDINQHDVNRPGMSGDFITGGWSHGTSLEVPA